MQTNPHHTEKELQNTVSHFAEEERADCNNLFNSSFYVFILVCGVVSFPHNTIILGWAVILPISGHPHMPFGLISAQEPVTNFLKKSRCVSLNILRVCD